MAIPAGMILEFALALLLKGFDLYKKHNDDGLPDFLDRKQRYAILKEKIRRKQIKDEELKEICKNYEEGVKCERKKRYS